MKNFTWGLTLGVPGDYMQWRAKTCYADINGFFGTLDTAYTNSQQTPGGLSPDQLMTAVNDIFMSFVRVAGSCYYFIDHIRNKINAFRLLMADFLLSESYLNQGDFYNSGMRLGFAISRMMA